MILINPFVLRRTKEEVAKDLPPLMEQVIICEMEEKQQRTYESEKSVIRNSILVGIDKDGIKNSAMIILRGFTGSVNWLIIPECLKTLKRADPASLKKFSECWRMWLPKNTKVLIFSSFVKHLELIGNGLKVKSGNTAC